MNPLTLFRRPPEPELAEDERDLDTPTFIRRTGEWRSGVRSVHLAPRPLEWTGTAPTTPGWYFVRRHGATSYEPYKVLPHFDYPSGFEWCGPLPQPKDGA